MNIGASWELSTTNMKFEYNTGDSVSQQILIVNNTGLLPIMYNFDVLQSTVFKLNKTKGELAAGKSEAIDFRACVKSDCTLHPIVVTNIHPKYSMCYVPYTISAEKQFMDCSMEHMYVQLNKCSGLYRKVEFKFTEPKTCTKGMGLPPSESVYCGIMIH